MSKELLYIIYLSIIFLLLKVLDIFTTWYVFTLGGEEANPFANILIMNSWGMFIFFKLLIAVLVIGSLLFVVYKEPEEMFKFSKTSLILLSIYYTIPVVWNTIGILVLKGYIKV
jgi:hypothetical protein